MRSQETLRDKFMQYLSRKLDPSRASQIVYNSQKVQQPPMMHHLSPHPSQYMNSNEYCNSPYENSINSSNISYSNASKRESMASGRSGYGGKTASIRKNKLRKVRDIQANVCSICLEDFKDRVEMSCRHSYCNDCLQEWLKTSSRCPYCRAQCPFYTKQGIRYPIQQKTYEHVPMEIDEGLDYECYMCEQTNQGDEVIICDRCQVYACHIHCDPRLRGIVLDDNEEWYCHFCS